MTTIIAYYLDGVDIRLGWHFYNMRAGIEGATTELVTLCVLQ